MKILSVSNSYRSVNFSGINLSKSLESGVKILKKSGTQNFVLDRKSLPAKKVTKILNGASMSSNIGTGEIAKDVNFPNILDNFKQAKNIMLGHDQFEGIESGISKVANEDTPILENVGKVVNKIIDLLFD